MLHNRTMTDLIPQSDLAKFAESERAIQQARTPFELAHFVVGQHDAEPRAWAQCTLELGIKIRNLRRAQIGERKQIRQIDYLETIARGDTPDEEAKKRADAADDADLAKIDLEEQSLAVLGAFREAQALKALYDSFGRTYTRDELNAAEPDYWRRRLNRQAMHDTNAHGRIGVGNQDALRMAGMPVPGLPDYTREVERRFLADGKVRILVAVPTLIPRAEVERDGLRCLEGWTLPGTVEQKLYVITGRPVAEAYTDAALTAMQDGADFVLCVEDDHMIPPGAFERLYDVQREAGPRACVGAWYPQKTEPRKGAAIVIRDGRREYLADDGAVHDVHTLPQGLTLIPTSIFRELPQPWFATTGSLTQDSFFSQLAREAGYRLLVDTSVRIKHVCRETGRVYA